MPALPSGTRLRRVDPAAVQRRGPFSHALTAVVASALGLAVSGSLALPSSAAPVTGRGDVGVAAPALPGAGTPTPSVDPSLLAAFPGADEVPVSEPLRKALVAERAAQRAEELAKNAEAVTRTARTAGGRARQRALDADERATQTEGARLAREALARAAAARAAAVAARLAAEQAARQAAEQAAAAAASTAPTTPSTSPAPVDPPVTTAPVTSTGGGVSPVPGAVVGASFGDVGLWSRYHTGLDFRAAYGTPIRAVKAGVVLYAGNSGNWSGNHVAVRHADGMTTMSSHMSSMAVRAGENVQAGQVIGYVGQTGRAFGAHLHFELYPAGVRYGDVYRAINPLPWLRAAGVLTH